VWAPAVIAAFLAWLSGTTFYHSLLKKYSWFAALQNLLVSDVESRLNIGGADIETYFLAAQAAEESEDEQGITNDFPLSTDVIESGVEEAVKAAEEIPVVGTVVQNFESVAVPAIVTVVENSTPAVAATSSGLGPRAF
jgi:hypothetical protein